MKNVLCISDNTETAVGLRLSGINSIVTENRNKALEILNKKIEDESIEIIIVTENIYKMIKQEIDEILDNYSRPLIVRLL